MSTTKFSNIVEKKFESTGKKKEIQKEAKEIFVTFGNNELLKGIISNNEFLTLWRPDALNQKGLGKLISGLICGFDREEDIANYISIVSKSRRDFVEINNNIRKCFDIMNSSSINNGEENFKGIGNLISVAIKFKMIDPSAIRLFQIWHDPDIWICYYNLYKSGEKNITATLSDENILRLPEYSAVSECVNEEGDILS